MEQKKGKDEECMEIGKLSSSLLPSESKTLDQTGRVNAVLNNPMLMDKIMKYSIYKSDGNELNKDTIIAVRLVSKSFLQCVSSVLKKSGKYLIEHLLYANPFHDIVNKFIPVFSKTSRSVDSILPVSLDIGQPFLRKRNIKYIRNLFGEFDDIISKLCVEYPLDGGSIKVNYDNLNFPILQNFSFEFQTYLQSKSPRKSDPSLETNANGLNFLQHILLNSPNLKYFTFKNNDEEAVNVSSLILPGTLKEIKFCSPISDNIFTQLTTSKLPHLNKLDLRIYQQAEMELIYSILEHFKKQLTNFSLEVFDNDEESESSICIRLPILEKLQELTLSGDGFILLPELRQVWSNLVPNLICVVFKNLNESVFLELIKDARFENVSSLNLKTSFCLSVPIMREIMGSFPSIKTLTLMFNLSDPSGLIYLFQNFTRLENLHLNIFHQSSGSLAGYKVVSTLLGISLEQAIALVDKTEANINIPIDNPNSIMNLKELRSLTLKAFESYSGRGRTNVLCSEIICKHGLEKMPKLQQINLLGGFEILE